VQRLNVDDIRRGRADQLATQRWDVLVVGGGILGAGAARDAALRGLSTALVEQFDMAFGTSSRTSRLLHGGIRYLAQGRIGLVYEASHEKRIIHRIAPHLAEPLPFVFPSYRGSEWPLWQLRVGVKAYDLLCGGKNLGPSSSMSAEDVRRHLPSPRAQGLRGAVRYYDGLTSDARLVLDTLQSAAAHGAVIANYTRLEEAIPSRQGWLCRVYDTRAERHYEISARTIIHATGPWAQALPQSSVRLRLTKGVHLVVDRERLPVPDAVVMSQGKRILFAIPWHRRVILGTTDTDYDGPLDDVRPDTADVDYILDIANSSFPSAGLNRADVIRAWAGLRPLIADSRGGPSDISRAHQILSPQPGWFDVAGGKLTTYRLIAEQTIDRVFRHLGLRPPPCRTADLPLLEASAGQTFSGITPPEVTPEAVEHYCANEWVVHLDDVMIRRTNWHTYHRHADEIARQVCRLMSEIYGWDGGQQQTELARYGRFVP
jgi:glycerol-3-phosphate dehydrogenase